MRPSTKSPHPGRPRSSWRPRYASARWRGLRATHAHRGFSTTVPASLKDGSLCVADALAHDTTTTDTTTLGERSFRCSNHSSAEGPWLSERSDASGLEPWC